MLSGVPLIDAEGYRANVGIVIINDRGQVFWARRFGQHSWQYPQGGVDEGESAEQTMYRELHEEVGLKPEHVKIVATTKHWLRYKLPKRLIRHESLPVCIGQKQKWFLLHLKSEESAVNMNCSDRPEFSEWQWVSYWYPVNQIIEFKRWVYQRMLSELSGTHAQKVAQLARR